MAECPVVGASDGPGRTGGSRCGPRHAPARSASPDARPVRAGHRSGLRRGESSAVFQRLVSPATTTPSADFRYAMGSPCDELSVPPLRGRHATALPGEAERSETASQRRERPKGSGRPGGFPRASAGYTCQRHVMDRGLPSFALRGFGGQAVLCCRLVPSPARLTRFLFVAPRVCGVRTTAHASFPSGVTDARLHSSTSLTLPLVAPPRGRLSRLRLGSPPSGWIRDLPVVLSSQHHRRAQ